jgi:hypothetical protein
MMIRRPLEIAVSGYALFIAFHLGFDVEGLLRDVVGFARSAAGVPDPDPAAGAHPEAPPPEDELGEPPYRILHLEDLAPDPAFPRPPRELARELDVTLADRLALVQVPAENGRAVFVTPSEVLRAQVVAAPIHLLEQVQRVRAADVLARATTPEAIAEALLVHPFAEDGARASRRRAELLLERGDLPEAVAAFEDAVARTDSSDPVALDQATARLALARRLREQARASETPCGEAWSGSVDVGGHRMGASGRAAWAMTAAGEIAWERSDALPEDFFARKVVGGQSGLAIVEAVANARAWVLALDEHGNVAWRVPLPAPGQGCGAVDQAFALGAGRVFVARTDRIIAIDASTGRVLWMHVHVSPVPVRPDDVEPAGWTPAPGPPRRRPDGRDGFRIRLGSDVLSVSSGRGRAVVKVDVRTGRAVDE